ncbi:hypothetical protein SDRG_07943 [Saprolegnia diclina VS20]|uniref:FHA domain-containing protein n=1 Tax=Saprolegnia diclina (strain VS20) TaxID=1156394 RepID=T0QIT1_SAPDV|nr:hypothetical protein SDRG_07943 [Saprolegnia diclina VS20]EQC34621.1 hypothetical protein SDRG_07943 [Saprolegnia diclina VS20]|eukprot:XP_008612027.1 hypothetical protein SDRG_07943 [Saprolegnia diclina VS20]
MVLHPARTDRPVTKLPLLLTASPSNVGVQIDSYRSKDVFNRPRSTAFTSAFHGFMFEDHRLQNAPRMSLRDAQRAQDAVRRQEKLAAYAVARHEAHIQLEEKRKHREYLRRLRIWEHHQALKDESERQWEHECANRIQALHRGYVVRKELAALHAAAAQIQAHVRRMTAQAAYRARRVAVSQEASATRIQAYMRRHLVAKRYPRRPRPASVVLPPKASNDQVVEPLGQRDAALIALPPTVASPATAVACDTDTMVTSKDDTDYPAQSERRAPTTVSIVRTPAPPPTRPCTTVLKRVGGGFRKIFQKPPTPKPVTAPRRTSPQRPAPSTPKQQTWNDIASRPLPQPKALQMYIQDPNLAEKLHMTLPLGEATPYTSVDRALLGADDCEESNNNNNDNDAMSCPETPLGASAVTMFSFGKNPLEVADWSVLLDKDLDARPHETPPITLVRPASRKERPVSNRSNGSRPDSADRVAEVVAPLTYTPSSDEQLRAFEAYALQTVLEAERLCLDDVAATDRALSCSPHNGVQKATGIVCVKCSARIDNSKRHFLFVQSLDKTAFEYDVNTLRPRLSQLLHQLQMTRADLESQLGSGRYEVVVTAALLIQATYATWRAAKQEASATARWKMSIQRYDMRQRRRVAAKDVLRLQRAWRARERQPSAVVPVVMAPPPDALDSERRASIREAAQLLVSLPPTTPETSLGTLRQAAPETNVLGVLPPLISFGRRPSARVKVEPAEYRCFAPQCGGRRFTHRKWYEAHLQKHYKAKERIAAEKAFLSRLQSTMVKATGVLPPIHTLSAPPPPVAHSAPRSATTLPPLTAPPLSAVLQLIRLDEPSPPRIIRIVDSHVLGRSSTRCDFVIESQHFQGLVSKCHARISVHGHGDTAAPAVQLDDLGSTNGTFVNGELVTSAIHLVVGDLVELGRVRGKPESGVVYACRSPTLVVDLRQLP